MRCSHEKWGGYRRAGNGIWSGANKRHGLDAVRLCSFARLCETGEHGGSQEPSARASRRCMVACALEFGAGRTDIYQILASSRNRDERSVPLSRGDLYAGRDGLFGGLN